MASSRGMNVPFSSWQAEGSRASTGVLVLVPGYNGKGEQMLDARWKAFATKNDLVLLAPTFRAEGKENNEGKGYYYPEQGSGEVMEKALKELEKRTGAETDKVLFFGFSAGAHLRPPLRAVEAAAGEGVRGVFRQAGGASRRHG